MPLNVANYHGDREALGAFARAECPNRAFFIDGEPGMGKSFTLEWLRDSLPAGQCLALVELDQPQGSQSPQLVMAEITDQIGRDHFPRFREIERRERERSASRVALVSGLRIEGNDNKVIASTAETPSDKALVARDFANALVEDLELMPVAVGQTVVVMLDGYHDPSETIHRWLFGVLVPRMTRVQHVRVIISGRAALAASLKRGIGLTHTSTLAGVSDVAEWESVMEAEGRTVRTVHIGSYLQAMVDYFGGAPGEIMRWMATLPHKEG